VASRGRGANRPAGRSGPRPPSLMAWRGQSLRLRSHCREPASWVRIRKPPRWSAERGPGRTGTRWSRLARATEVKECACRRSIHPSSGGRNCCCRDGRWRQSPVGSPADAKVKAHAKGRRNPGAATRRGNEQHCAVWNRELRRRPTAHGRAATSRVWTACAAPQAWRSKKENALSTTRCRCARRDPPRATRRADGRRRRSRRSRSSCRAAPCRA
jgi:hypothetical protein